MTRHLTKRKRWQHAAIIGGTAATAAAIALPGALAAGPPAPFFAHGTNGFPAPSNGDARQVDEGLGGQGALLTSVSGGTSQAGYGVVGVKGGDGTAKTFSGLTDVETQFNVTQGTCTGGAPRWVIHVSNPSNPKDTAHFWVYFDNSHPGGGCAPGAQQETNIIGDQSNSEWYVNNANTPSSYSAVKAQYGSWNLQNVEVAVDAGWGQGAQLNPNIQQVLLQNLKVNNASYFKLPS